MWTKASRYWHDKQTLAHIEEEQSRNETRSGRVSEVSCQLFGSLVQSVAINFPTECRKSRIIGEKVKTEQTWAALLSDIDSSGGVVSRIRIKSAALREDSIK